jgi:hypothetical protein
LRLEPLESRTVLSASGLYPPAAIVQSLLAGPWPGPVSIQPAPAIEVARQFPQSEVDRAAALKIVATENQALFTVTPAGAGTIFNSPVAPTDRPQPSEPARVNTVNLTVKATALAEKYSIPTVQAMVLMQNDAAFNATSSMHLGSTTVVSSGVSVDQLRENLLNSRTEAGSAMYFISQQPSTDNANNPAVMLSAVPRWLQTAQADHPGSVKAADPRAAAASHETSSVAGGALKTLIASDEDGKPAMAGQERWSGAETLEKGGFVAPTAEGVPASTAVPDWRTGITGDSAAETVASNTYLATSLDDDLSDFGSPLSRQHKSSGEDASDEGGYVRIGSSNTARAATANDRYSVLDFLWRESNGEPRAGAERRQPARSTAGVTHAELRRTSRAGDSDDGGLIELSPAAGANAVCVVTKTDTTDEGMALAARSIRMDEGLGLFQAFEVATTEAYDASASAIAVSPHGVDGAVSTSAPSAANTAAVSVDKPEQVPAQRAATALGIVVVSAFTVFQDRRRSAEGQSEERVVFNRRRVRIDPIL